MNQRDFFQNPNTETIWASWLQQAVLQIAPKDIFLVGGRGSTKTTGVVASRTQQICYEMPGAQMALTADTYANANANIIDSMLEGWTRYGWIEGIHYVKGIRPPKHFKAPYRKVTSFKHSLITHTGNVMTIVSQDRPSIGAGNSYQHQIGDEAKYLIKRKLDKLTAALRSSDYVRFSKSPFYLGKTYTTDYPNVALGEHDWILGMAKYMDQEQILLCFKLAIVINEIRIELLELNQNPQVNKHKIRLAEKRLERWIQRWKIPRKNSIFFYNISSLINVDNLTIDYFKDQLISLGKEEFLTAILGLEPQLPLHELFYPYLGSKHLYQDGYHYGYLDEFELGKRFISNSRGLKYCDENKVLELGFDAGNMNSLVIGQTANDESWTRILCELYTYAPEQPKDLGKLFRDFFVEHKYKEVDIYHDRAANNYRLMKLDFAHLLQQAIEKDENGNWSGWRVNLKSRNQGNITQTQEHNHVKNIMSGKVHGLPKLLIDKHNCPVLLSSMRNAKVIVKVGTSGHKHFAKDKSSEKKFAGQKENLIWKSTNMSDAFKYYICRPGWLKISEQTEAIAFSDPEVY
jgi:hypothetical protein